MVRERLKKILFDAVRLKWSEIANLEFSLQISENQEHGHYFTNIAFVLAKILKKSPLEAANSIKEAIVGQLPEFIGKIEVAPPGFINFWIADKALHLRLSDILQKKVKYGRGEKKKEKINLEFISANPTGPLTMANGRGGFLGDVLANVLKFSGYSVTREYLINDAGRQVRLLGESVLAAAGKLEPREDYYRGAYIKELAKKFSAKIKKGVSAAEIGVLAADCLLEEIKKSVKEAGIVFNVWTSESKKIRRKGLVDDLMKELLAKDLVSEHDGAQWLKKETAGEKERVLRKSDGEYTYYAVDLAYHLEKLKRFDKIIDIWGADHHGNVLPLKAGLELFGVEPERLKVIMLQFVRLVRGGKEVKMSKRAGEFVTLDELIKEVGKDVARFFFLMVNPETHMDFDLKLAKRRSMKNPVYYAQYAYVRCKGVLDKWQSIKGKLLKLTADFNLLDTKQDKKLIFELTRFPEIVADIAGDYQVSRLARYATELAKAFHDFYEKERIVGEKEDIALARLRMVQATKIVFENTFGLLGIDRPKKM